MAYSFAIFTSAFLVFQVQPIIARFILPWFGGSSSVWATCMLFFQLGLLGGYSYAHLLAKRLSLKNQCLLHLTLVLLSIALLPIAPNTPDLGAESNQVVAILEILFFSIGIPFILLSASAPLLQHWFANVHTDKKPYRLYALSNLGSLLALLSYPFIIEPKLTLENQSFIWSLLYGAFFIALAGCAWPLRKRQISASLTTHTSTPKFNGQSALDRLTWVLLAATGSILLLAITNHMSQDIAPIPFLWVLPLSLYLCTFIISFERESWYQRFIWIPLMLASNLALFYLLHSEINDTQPLSLLYQVIIFCSAMFSSCMVCHGEMVRRCPAKEELTSFYLYVALGGAVGGVFVNVLAPVLLDGYWELHLGLLVALGSALTFVVVDMRHKKNLWIKPFASVCVVGWMLAAVFLWHHANALRNEAIVNTRGFYGVLRVFESGQGTQDLHRSLFHGRIRHGEQWFNSKLQQRPTSYFGLGSGVNYALERHPKRLEKQALTVGVIGLGVGTLAAYRTPPDTFIFYDINPQVVDIAQKYFEYLNDSGLSKNIVIGDGRLMLKRELQEAGPHRFDVLIIDAFSGDAIPTHLLTTEASQLYWNHLNADGILAVHISNRYIDLTDVVRQLALDAKKEALSIQGRRGSYTTSSHWMLVTSNERFLQDRRVTRHAQVWSTPPKPLIWTDNFSNLMEVVNW